jgi:hypothetical protein
MMTFVAGYVVVEPSGADQSSTVYGIPDRLNVEAALFVHVSPVEDIEFPTIVVPAPFCTQKHSHTQSLGVVIAGLVKFGDALTKFVKLPVCVTEGDAI